MKIYRPNKRNVSKKVLNANSKRIMKELGYIRVNGKWVSNTTGNKGLQ